MRRLAVLASGKGTNLQALLDAARAGALPAQVALVMSDHPDAQALERAATAGVEALALSRSQFPNRQAHEAALAAHVERAGAELICLAGYMRLLGPDFVRRFAGRIVNVHPSLLPSFPGLHAVREALARGVRVTGCTVHFVDEGVDSGPIVHQVAVPVEEGDTEAALHARIKEAEHRAYPEAVRWWCEGWVAWEGGRVVRRVPSGWR